VDADDLDGLISKEATKRAFLLDPAVLDAPSTPTKPPRAAPFADQKNAKPSQPHSSSSDDEDDFTPVPMHHRRRSLASTNTTSPPSSHGNGNAHGRVQQLVTVGSPSSSMSTYAVVSGHHDRDSHASQQQQQQQQQSKDPPVLCTFHLEGNCRYGAQCRNIHGEYCSICGKAALVPNDSEQNEDHMFECAEKQRLKEDLDESRKFSCEQCGDNVVDKGKRFGILSTDSFSRDSLLLFLHLMHCVCSGLQSRLLLVVHQGVPQSVAIERLSHVR